MTNYELTTMPAQTAAARLSVDEIIAPARTRATIATTLRHLAGVLRPEFRHDNLPQ